MKEKARERNLGQVTSRERNESEPLPCRKELDGVETTVVRRSWDKAPAVPVYGRSGIRHSRQAIDVETLKGQLATGGTRGFDGGRQLSTDGTSRMNREVQVRICEGLGVKFPGPTRRVP